MKKLFVILLGSISISNAATIKWEFYGPESFVSDGVTAYSLMTDVTPDAITSLTDISNVAWGTSGFSKLADYAHTKEVASNNDFSAGTYTYYLFLTLRKDGKDYYWKSTKQSKYFGSENDAPVLNAFNSNGDLDGTLSDITNWTQITADVPEPTTLALLALGIAAFGLKRKVS